MKTRKYNDWVNEDAKYTHYPYQVDDLAGRKLYDKAALALDDQAWVNLYDEGTDNYREVFPLKTFLKKSKMTMNELEKLMKYGDESWGMYISDDKLMIDHD